MTSIQDSTPVRLSPATPSRAVVLIEPVRLAIGPALEGRRMGHLSVQPIRARDVPARHPERLLFEWTIGRLGLSWDERETLWLELLSGTKLQAHLNQALRAQRLAGRPGPLTYNPHFERVAQQLGPFLELGPRSGPLALWARVPRLSVFAQLRGYATVERTPAGRALAPLELHRDPRAVWPLWRRLSRELVRRNPSGPLHVFVVSHQPASALFRRTLPLVDPADPSRPTTWHPVSPEALRVLPGDSSH